MAYQQEKDMRLYENAAIANDNVRLSIFKQGEMVSFLSQISTVISHSLKINIDTPFPSMPQSAHGDQSGSATHSMLQCPTSRHTTILATKAHTLETMFSLRIGGSKKKLAVWSMERNEGVIAPAPLTAKWRSSLHYIYR